MMTQPRPRPDSGFVRTGRGVSFQGDLSDLSTKRLEGSSELLRARLTPPSKVVCHLGRVHREEPTDPSPRVLP